MHGGASSGAGDADAFAIQLRPDLVDAVPREREKAARVLGGRSVGVRPPVPGGDWCDFEGGREEFVRFVAEARASGSALLEVMTASEMCALPDPPVSDRLLGPLVVRGQRLVLGGHTGEGKTTLALQLVRAIVNEEPFWSSTASAGVSWCSTPNRVSRRRSVGSARPRSPTA